MPLVTVVGCIGGDGRDGTLVADTRGEQTAADVPCPDNCGEAYPVVPACTRAIWNDATCTCRLEPLAENAPCDDRNACTFEDRCSTGACVGVPVDGPTFCDDADPCTDDRCDVFAGCVNEVVPDGELCDDGNDCTYDEVCTDGICHWQAQYVCSVCDTRARVDTCEAQYGNGLRCDGTLACTAGFCEVDPATVPKCDDPRLGPCRLSECDTTIGACVTTTRKDGSPCLDRSPCTTGDTCQDGGCVGERVEVEGCLCDRDEDCLGLDDGDLCNGIFGCAAGICRFAFESIVVCDSSDDHACSRAACDPGTGLCAPVPAENGSPCDDGIACTDDDFCDEGVCGGTPRDCSELDGVCVRGACDPKAGCLAVPADEGGACDPKLRCVESGTCDDGVCVPRAAPCDDDDACTADVCEASGECSHLGPPRPTCLAQGVCADGVPLACDAGAYRCAYEDVVGFGDVELCDELDNDCDGQTDDGCVAAVACPPGTLAAAYDGGTMQACRLPEGGGRLVCGAGFHACTYSEMVKSLGDLAPPTGYVVAASIAWDPASGHVVNDRPQGGCFEFEGLCSLGHEVQAISWDGVFAGVIAYAAEAWGCEAGQPTSSCDDFVAAGIMCCGNVCENGEACDDGSACTIDSCDLTRGRCVNQEKERPACKSVGVCAGHDVTCAANGTFVCGYLEDPLYQAEESACDGLDNDCDGKTDADDSDLSTHAPLCDRTLGICADARKPLSLCVGGAWLPCTAATYTAHDARYEPGGETSCDGVDNDCDGESDNAFVYGGAMVGETCDGVGACGEGVVVCGPYGASATCSTNPDSPDSHATAEDCNGLDDDCDGATDEPTELDPALAGCAMSGVCEGGVAATCVAGHWICHYDDVAGYSPDESCNGVDENCDGATDEGFELAANEVGVTLPLGAACGTGDCQNGRVICAASGDHAICSSDLDGGVELCDGIDNDCDEKTDEDLAFFDVDGETKALGDHCEAVGECDKGEVECGANLETVCSTRPGGSESQAVAERCNQRDDDCDGQTDDGLAYAGQPVGEPCDGLGRCGAGLVVCAASGQATCSTNPDGTTPGNVPEVCNGVDDDCDDTTDDGVLVGPNDCSFAGVCTAQSGTFTCRGTDGWSCDFSTVQYYQAANETNRCDGRDNDCDGQTDEDYPLLGTACDGPDADQCKKGTVVCKAEGNGTLCQGDTLQVEACNGVDDDCDGQTDEPGANGCTTFYVDSDRDGWGVATSTACLCAAAEGYVAQAGDCEDAQSAINPGRPELCNGKDDDCDGGTDAAGDAADLVVDDARACELTSGVCDGAKKPASRCVGGAWQPCQSADYVAHDARYQSVEQSCDGVDNDCDGKVDSADTGMAAFRPPCGNQNGVCQGALTPLDACTASGWAACGNVVYAAYSAYFESGQEVSCDGRDNDCDAGTDDPFTFAGKLVGQSCDGTGACGAGVVQCRADGTAATCSSNPDGTAPEGGPEICNNVDDDCDGATDEGLGVLQSTCRLSGQCNGNNVQATCSQGVWLCSYAGVPGYENGVELTCDGLDNDCDGASDEDFSLVVGNTTLRKGDPCGNGTCLGSVICHSQTPEPGDLVCSSSLANQPEVCDGRDNDCDGSTDEGLTWTPPGGQPIGMGSPCDGIGACGAGTVVCAASQTPTCSTNPDGPSSGAVAESCNGLDDDCDGVVDDGFSWQGVSVGRACDGTGECGAGKVECRPGGASATCSTNADGSQTQAEAETCNGADDDCDGATDDGLGVFDSDCLLEGVCTKDTVVATCTGGVWNCEYKAVPNYHAGDEIGYCDELDNDCDGEVDEDYPEVGMPCDDPSDADLCAYGEWSCSLTTLPVDPAAVPEGAAPPVDPGERVPACWGDVPSPEYCNHVDDDCDALTDEPNAVDCDIYFRDFDGDDFGNHAVTACLCAADPATFMTSQSFDADCDDNEADINPSADEVCNGVDDDCDGETDEDDAIGCQDRYYDGDGDDYGTQDVRCLCEDWMGEETGHTAHLPGDCNDDDELSFPGARERCDNIDNDCDGPADEGENNIDCRDYYLDGDNDTYGSTASKCLCQPSGNYKVTNSNDCCDADARVRPNQQSYFSLPADQCSKPWDFNCNGTTEKKVTTLGSCSCSAAPCAACATVQGWVSLPIPDCGQSAPFLNKCTLSELSGGVCAPEIRNDMRQFCR